MTRVDQKYAGCPLDSDLIRIQTTLVSYVLKFRVTCIYLCSLVVIVVVVVVVVVPYRLQN